MASDEYVLTGNPGELVLRTVADVVKNLPGGGYYREEGGIAEPYALKFVPGGDPTDDPNAYVFTIEAGKRKRNPSTPIPSPVTPPVTGVVANRITFGQRGAALQWSPAAETDIRGYHIERSHEDGFPAWSYLRVTAVPIKQLTFQNMWAWEGEKVSYKIYKVLADGSLVLHAELNGTQTPFSTTYRTTTLVITDAMTSPTQETVFENIHFRPDERVHCIHIQTRNRVLIRNGTAYMTGDFIYGSDLNNVRIHNMYIRGKVPATRNYSVGTVTRMDYQRTFQGMNNLIRECGGIHLGQWRGLKKAEGGVETKITGNIFFNLHRRRSDGAGGTIRNTIASSYVEGSTRGLSNPSATGGFTVPVGREFANCLNLNATNATAEGTVAQFFGGLDFAGNLCIQEPGRGFMEDAFNFNQQGGEPTAFVKVRGWLILGNYGDGISATGQYWQSGMPWHMGGQMQPADGYVAGYNKPSGNYTTPYQSMTGGLMQDGHSDTTYLQNGAWILAEDVWLLGPGTMFGTQHSHDQQINRGRSIITGKDRSGTISTSGDNRTGFYMYADAPKTKTVQGQLLGHHLGISNTHQISPTAGQIRTSAEDANSWLDPALTFNNTFERRAATRQEEDQALLDHLTWCHTNGIALGPQFPAPALVYS